MPWIQKSFIFKPSGDFPWSRTHAQVPTALLLKDRIRIYYATRNAQGRSLTSFIDVARDNPSHILHIHDQPILPLGKIGTHDEDGVMAGCVVAYGSDVLFYYTGWSRGVTVPYRVSIGLAKSTDGGITFDRVHEGPITDRTALEPYMTMSPYVLQNGGIWQMWYGSGTGWVEVEGHPEPLYIIKYAESQDGVKWLQDNTVCIPPLHPLEANTRPSIIKSAAGYEMWFSYRHSIDFRGGAGAYHIGHAISQDGKSWQRQADPAGLAPAQTDWNNRMMAYPSVLEYDGKRIMFHNGNGFGASGFGYAVWENA